MKLTDKELELIEKLCECYEMFISLEKMHPSDNSEFCHHIHILQRQVMCRLARREHSDLFGEGASR